MNFTYSDAGVFRFRITCSSAVKRLLFQYIAFVQLETTQYAAETFRRLPLNSLFVIRF